MTDFEKMMNNIPPEMVAEERFQTTLDEMKLNPDLAEIQLAIFFAQHIVFKIPELYAKACEDFREVTELETKPLTVMTAIGVMRLLSMGLSLEFAEDSEDPIAVALMLYADGKRYDQLVRPFVTKLKELRKA